MTARPLRSPKPRTGFRVIAGRRPRHVQVAPWVVFTSIVVTAFIGIVVARTMLDQGAFELSELRDRIEAESRQNEQLTLDAARLESPARIGPLAEELGLVYPTARTPLYVEADPGSGNASVGSLASGSES